MSSQPLAWHQTLYPVPLCWSAAAVETLPFNRLSHVWTSGATADLSVTPSYAVCCRDLKLDNVLCNASRNPVIADFGLAKMFAPNEHQPLMHTMIGTWSHMGFAVWATVLANRGRRDSSVVFAQGYGPDTDLYAIGVMMVHFLSADRNLVEQLFGLNRAGGYIAHINKLKTNWQLVLTGQQPGVIHDDVPFEAYVPLFELIADLIGLNGLQPSTADALQRAQLLLEWYKQTAWI